MPRHAVLEEIKRLESQLNALRSQILQEEKIILELERKAFASEQQIEAQLLTELEQTGALENKNQSELQALKKQLGQQIRHLNSKTKAQQLANALVEQQLLEKELTALQNAFQQELAKKEHSK